MRPQITPIGNLMVMGRYVNHDPRGGALMVEMTMPRYSYHIYAAPVSSQWLDYFQDQPRFLSSLPKELCEKVLLRLYGHDYGWDQVARW